MTTPRRGPVPAPRLRFGAKREHTALNGAPDMPPAIRSEILVEHDVPIRMPDGTVLLHDHWLPAEDPLGSVLLLRTPYGRRPPRGIAQGLAERGHHVLVQSCRGTFGSGEPPFLPFVREAEDGRATLAWIREQPWATGPVHTFGPSYLGLTQWALVDAGEAPDAMTVPVSARRVDTAVFYAGGGLSIESILTWVLSLHSQESAWPVRTLALLRAARRIRRAADVVPVSDAARSATGTDSPPFDDWIAHRGAADPWWEPLHFAKDVDRVPPVTLLAGWQDLFLAGGIDDYLALRGAGRAARLIVGDWTHDSPESMVAGIREALWRLAGAEGRPRVSIEVTGGGGWQNREEWPPASSPVVFSLTAQARLTMEDPGAAGERTYRYDPSDPTPSAGGRSLNPFTSGRRSQRRRERRDDVLVFRTAPLDEDLTGVGVAHASLALTSTNPSFDVFLRLCDVHPDGTAHTVCDAYVRAPRTLEGRIELDFAPMGHRFAPGHRIALQVSSGAHPLHLRNLGGADPVLGEPSPSDQRLRVGRGGSSLSIPEVRG